MLFPFFGEFDWLGDDDIRDDYAVENREFNEHEISFEKESLNHLESFHLAPAISYFH